MGSEWPILGGYLFEGPARSRHHHPHDAHHCWYHQARQRLSKIEIIIRKLHANTLFKEVTPLLWLKTLGGCCTVVQKWVGFGWDWMDLRLWWGIERFTMLITWHVWEDSPAKVENSCPVCPTLRTSKGYCLEGLRGIFSHIRGRKDSMESHLGNAFTSNQRDLKVFALTNIRFQGISLK